MKKLQLNKKTFSVLDKKEMRTVTGGKAQEQDFLSSWSFASKIGKAQVMGKAN
jgi:natural product precursor